MEKEFNVTQLCRVCAWTVDQRSEYYSIFESEVEEQMRKCFPSIQISRHDGLPDKICRVCKLRLNQFSQFQDGYECTEQLLMQHAAGSIRPIQLQDEIAIKEEIEEIPIFEVNGDEVQTNDDEIPQTSSSVIENEAMPELEDRSAENNSGYQSRNEFESYAVQQNPDSSTDCDSTLLALYKCDTCEDTFISNDALTKHNMQHLVNWDRDEENDVEYVTVYPCRSCPKSFESENTFLKHLKHFHNNINGLAYGRQSANPLSQRGKKQSKIAPWRSQNSELIFEDGTDMCFTCNICRKEFKSAADLHEHTEIHNGKQTIYSCSKCPKTFPSRDMILLHSCEDASELVDVKPKIKHPEVTLRDIRFELHECKFCGTFLEWDDLLEHCQQGDCLKLQNVNETVSENSETKTKVSIGESEKTYLDRFSKKKRFKKQEFVCSVCGKSYENRSSLYTHKKRLHPLNGEKCKCGLTYSNLMDHMKTHHKKKNRCGICHKQFFYEAAYTVHVKMHMAKTSYGPKPPTFRSGIVYTNYV